MMFLSKIFFYILDKTISQKDFNYKYCKKAQRFLYPYILSKIYYNHLHQELNLRKPVNFTDKIQWLKLYDASPLKTLLSDKLEAKKWVTENIPFIKVPQVYTSADSFKDIDLSICPEHFALKTNHGCKMNELVKDKSLFSNTEIYNEISSYFEKLLKVDYAFVSGFEMQYHKIKRKIFCEEWINYPNHILDYKIHCFNGEPKYIDYMTKDIENNRTVLIFYDTEWNNIPSFFGNPATDKISIERPINLEKMLEAARIIAKHFKYVRVDLYNLHGEIYFAEATFSPFSGFIIFNKPEYNLLWGNMLKL